MTIELNMLALSVALGLIQIVTASHAASMQRGYRWAAGPRDEIPPPLTGIAGRLDRAVRNFLETVPSFAAAVLVAQIVGRHDWMTVWGVQLYFWARPLRCALCIWRSFDPLFSLERGNDRHRPDPVRTPLSFPRW